MEDGDGETEALHECSAPRRLAELRHGLPHLKLQERRGEGQEDDGAVVADPDRVNEPLREEHSDGGDGQDKLEREPSEVIE